MVPFRRSLILTVVLVIVLTLQGCAFFDSVDFPYESNSYAYEDKMLETRTLLRRANVGVNVEYKSDGTWVPGSGSSGESQGSGVVIASDETYYYALTNFHVIDPRDYDEMNVTVVPSMEDVMIDAEVVASDASRDLALLKFEIGDQDIGQLLISEAQYDKLERKALLLAVGNPSAVNSIVTFGQYHGMVNTDDVTFNVIYHSALIYPGNSGGALADMEGYLIGLNTWGVEGEPERNLAVPLPEILAFLEAEGYWDSDDHEDADNASEATTHAPIIERMIP